MEKSAILSDCGKYRYRLGRVWDAAAPVVAVIMLNPSTADAHLDDATVRRCVGFAKAWGYGGLLVGNLFAYRATDPGAIRTASAPIGPLNDAALCEIAKDSASVVCAWGRGGAYLRRDHAVIRLLATAGVRPLRLSKPGQTYPMHPLYLPAGRRPVPMEAG